MLFILQNINNCNSLTVDITIIKEIIDNSKHSLDKYEFLSNDDFFNNGVLKNEKDFPKEYKNAIPFGSIEFTTNFLKIFKHIDKINPIEVPTILRNNEFLKREYKILSKDSLPATGRFFIKNASKLKEGTFICSIEDLHKDNYFNGNDLYQISEIVNPISEYRVYVIGGKVYAIAYYDGDPCVFPDVNLIKKANIIYSLQKDYPKSYTMDVMVTDKGTCITEIHILLSCGIYQTVLGRNFLFGYDDAMKYLEKYNTEPTPTE